MIIIIITSIIITYLHNFFLFTITDRLEHRHICTNELLELEVDHLKFNLAIYIVHFLK